MEMRIKSKEREWCKSYYHTNKAEMRERARYKREGLEWFTLKHFNCFLLIWGW